MLEVESCHIFESIEKIQAQVAPVKFCLKQLPFAVKNRLHFF